MIQPNKTNRIGKYAGVNRMAERDEREQQRTVASVLSQRTKTLPCGRENVKKESDLINARPKKTFGYKIPAFLFEKELQVLRFI